MRKTDKTNLSGLKEGFQELTYALKEMLSQTLSVILISEDRGTVAEADVSKIERASLLFKELLEHSPRIDSGLYSMLLSLDVFSADLCSKLTSILDYDTLVALRDSEKEDILSYILSCYKCIYLLSDIANGIYEYGYDSYIPDNSETSQEDSLYFINPEKEEDMEKLVKLFSQSEEEDSDLLHNAKKLIRKSL